GAELHHDPEGPVVGRPRQPALAAHVDRVRAGSRALVALVEVTGGRIEAFRETARAVVRRTPKPAGGSLEESDRVEGVRVQGSRAGRRSDHELDEVPAR